MSHLLCIGCYADPELQPDCSLCRGTGKSTWIPWAPRPWDEIAPDLWLGGYDFHPPMGSAARFTTELLVEANFDVVISFYTPHDVVLDPGVEHHRMRIPDGMLHPDELVRVQELGELAYWRSHCEGKKVLIHCQAGLNRSSLCMAFALRHLGWSVDRSIDHIRKTRSPFCLVNKDFVDYLKVAEHSWLAGGNAISFTSFQFQEALRSTFIGREAIASVKLDGETQVIENTGDQT